MANINSSTCQVVFRRWNHSQNDQHINAGNTDSTTQMESSTQQQQNLHEKRKVDPFAKRPSQKCDPYGLAGQSLSHKECLDWLLTLDSGWKLIGGDTDSRHETEDSEEVLPIFLQKQFYHATFHDASLFLSQISLLSTNLNHYPFLSMERVLVDDLSIVSNIRNSEQDATSTSAQISKQKRRKVKGWVFVSTVRCSTYRPPTTTHVDLDKKDDSSQCKDNKGLTYHDFHLAMNIDIETNREGVNTWISNHRSQ